MENVLDFLINQNLRIKRLRQRLNIKQPEAPKEKKEGYKEGKEEDHKQDKQSNI